MYILNTNKSESTKQTMKKALDSHNNKIKAQGSGKYRGLQSTEYIVGERDAFVGNGQ